MTRNFLLALAFLTLACKVEKTGQDTYKVVAPTPQAKAAAEKAKEEAKAVAEKLKQETAKVTEKAKTETTATTSTVQTQTGTKTEKRSKTTTRY